MRWKAWPRGPVGHWLSLEGAAQAASLSGGLTEVDRRHHHTPSLELHQCLTLWQKERLWPRREFARVVGRAAAGIGAHRCVAREKERCIGSLFVWRHARSRRDTARASTKRPRSVSPQYFYESGASVGWPLYRGTRPTKRALSAHSAARGVAAQYPGFAPPQRVARTSNSCVHVEHMLYCLRGGC